MGACKEGRTRTAALAVALAMSLWLLPLAEAQTCGGMYTYNEVGTDGSGEIIGENYTQASYSYCGDYTTRATVTLILPNGQQSNSASGASYAEAVASLPAGSPGSASYDGDNEVDFLCGDFLYGGFSDLFSIRDTYWGPPPIVQNDTCYYTRFACSTGTPTCKEAPPGISFVPSCPSYMRGRNLVVGGTCIFALGTAASGPGPCD